MFVEKKSAISNNVKITVIAVVSLVILVLAIWYLFIILNNDNYKEYKNIDTDNKLVGELTENIDEKEEYYKGLYYPNFEYKKLNKYVDNIIKSIDKDIYKDGAESIKDRIFFLDYQSYQVFDSFIVVVMDYKEMDKDSNIISNKKIYINYDIKKDKILNSEDCFRNNYKADFKEKAIANGFIESDDMYKDFVIKEEEITIFNNNNSLSIPYNEYKKYIKLQNVNIPSLAPTEIIKPREFKVDKNKPMIALTYDDGPCYNTEAILDMLKEEDVPATFFVLGSRVSTYPDIMKRVYREGHLVGTHSWSHANLHFSTNAQIDKEIDDSKDAVFKYTGYDPIYFRSPYGNTTDYIKQKVGEKHVVKWNVDTLDWSSKNADKVFATMMRDSKENSIVLMHDLYECNVDASRRFIKEMKAKGYQFVTVDKIVEKSK